MKKPAPARRTRRPRPIPAPPPPKPARAAGGARAFFAVTAPGLESLAAQELQALGLPGEVQPGGVAFSAARRDLYRANLHLRTASRVLVRLDEPFHAAEFWELSKKAARLPWPAYLRPGQPVALRVTCHKSRLYHSGAVAERLLGAIGQALGQTAGQPPPAPPAPDDSDDPPSGQLVVARIVDDACTISLDTSGALLHQRGYRAAAGRAPLRETLAAAMLLASGWDRALAPLLDPFCGAGTLVIEAALLALDLAPGRLRRFAFMDWPDYDPDLWQRLLAKAEPRPAGPPPLLLGSDRDAGAVAAAQANAERAGVAGAVYFDRRAVSAIEPPPGPGWVVTNPPYGVRVSGGGDLRNLYAQFGRVLRQKCRGWRLAMLSADERLAAQVGLPFERDRTLSLINGGLRVKLLQAQI